MATEKTENAAVDPEAYGMDARPLRPMMKHLADSLPQFIRDRMEEKAKQDGLKIAAE